MKRIDRKTLELSYVLIVGLAPTLFSAVHLTFLAPLLVFLCYRLAFVDLLWAAAGAGLLMDLLAADGPFGLYALAYCLTAACLYQRKQNFFEDGWLALPILSGSFALLSTLLLFGLLRLLGHGFAPTWPWIATDLVLLPLLDALWAFTLYTVPLLLLLRRKHRMRDYRMPRPR